MRSFLSHLMTPTKSLLQQLRQSSDFLTLLLFLITLIVTSTIFYVTSEGWRPLDALYFVVVTITTVGYGDVTPQSDVGKIYTMGLIFSGVGTTVAFITLLAQHAVDYQKESFNHMKNILISQQENKERKEDTTKDL